MIIIGSGSLGGKDSELSQYGCVHVILNTIVIYHFKLSILVSVLPDCLLYFVDLCIARLTQLNVDRDTNYCSFD